MCSPREAGTRRTCVLFLVVELRGTASVTRLSVDAEYGREATCVSGLEQKSPIGQCTAPLFRRRARVSRIGHAHSPAVQQMLAALLAWPPGERQVSERRHGGPCSNADQGPAKMARRSRCCQAFPSVGHPIVQLKRRVLVQNSCPVHALSAKPTPVTLPTRPSHPIPAKPKAPHPTQTHTHIHPVILYKYPRRPPAT